MTTPQALLVATRDLPAPLAILDEHAIDANLNDLAKRAAGTPIRIATKSVRVRAIIERALQHPGFSGLMTYSLAESNWLADLGHDDILLAYPSVDVTALRALAASDSRRAAITLMVDSAAMLNYTTGVLGTGHAPIRVCIDIDASLKLAGQHLGVRRSPVHDVSQARALAEVISKRPGFTLVGAMLYDAQIAGMPDTSPIVRQVKKRSANELLGRRAEVIAAIREYAELEFVNGGGTGSIEVDIADPTITEVTAGSGIFCPTLFDGYKAFEPRPAGYFATDVVRKPAPHIATCFSGGYIASGPAGASRVPTPVYPEGLRLISTEGTGEVQTPVTGQAARGLHIGDRVLWRHAKAGEMCERISTAAIVAANGAVQTVPTYRGEGKNFG